MIFKDEVINVGLVLADNPQELLEVIDLRVLPNRGDRITVTNGRTRSWRVEFVSHKINQYRNGMSTHVIEIHVTPWGEERG